MPFGPMARSCLANRFLHSAHRCNRCASVLYGAGPHTVLESYAKRADERLHLEDLRRATKVIARVLCDLLVYECLNRRKIFKGP